MSLVNNIFNQRFVRYINISKAGPLRTAFIVCTVFWTNGKVNQKHILMKYFNTIYILNKQT